MSASPSFSLFPTVSGAVFSKTGGIRSIFRGLSTWPGQHNSEILRGLFSWRNKAGTEYPVRMMLGPSKAGLSTSYGDLYEGKVLDPAAAREHLFGQRGSISLVSHPSPNPFTLGDFGKLVGLNPAATKSMVNLLRNKPFTNTTIAPKIRIGDGDASVVFTQAKSEGNAPGDMVVIPRGNERLSATTFTPPTGLQPSDIRTTIVDPPRGVWDLVKGVFSRSPYKGVSGRTT